MFARRIVLVLFFHVCVRCCILRDTTMHNVLNNTDHDIDNMYTSIAMYRARVQSDQSQRFKLKGHAEERERERDS